MFLSEVCKQKGLCILLLECNPHKDQSNNVCMVMTNIHFIILNIIKKNMMFFTVPRLPYLILCNIELQLQFFVRSIYAKHYLIDGFCLHSSFQQSNLKTTIFHFYLDDIVTSLSIAPRGIFYAACRCIACYIESAMTALPWLTSGYIL